MAFDLEGAKKAGYSDAEIAEYLGSQANFDVAAAKKSGYSDVEIINHLSTAKAPEKTAEAQQPVATTAGEGSVLDDLKSWFKGVTEKSMTPKYDDSTIAGISKGITDPFTGAAQLALKGAEALGSEGAGQQAEILRQKEKEYAAARSDGFDWSRLAGNVLSPLSLVTGPGTGYTQAATTGAIQAGLQPVASKDYLTGKALQVGTGAVLGPAVQGLFAIAGKTVSGAKDFGSRLFTEKGQQKALREYLDNLAGPDKDSVIKALQDSAELVKGSRPTAAEVVADLPGAVRLMKEQQLVAGKSKTATLFAAREAEQQAAREAALAPIAGTPEQMAAVAAKRAAVTGARRETALAQADVAGKVAPKLEQEISDLYAGIASATHTAEKTGFAAAEKSAEAAAGKPGWLTAGDIAADAAGRSSAYAGKAETLRKNLRLKELQLDSLEKNGFFPLKADDLIVKLDKAINSTVNEQAKLALTTIKESIEGAADKNGIVSSRWLYENIRKPASSDIASLLKKPEFAAGGVPKHIADTVSNAKKFVDAAIDQSSGGLWTKYLKTFSAYSKKMDRMELGTALADKLKSPLDKETAGIFAKAIEDAPKTIKSATGIPNKNLGDVLTPKEVNIVKAIQADLIRKAKSNTWAAKVKEGVEDALTEKTINAPTLLDRTLNVMNYALDFWKKGHIDKFHAKLAELMLDPKAMAEVMTAAVPKSQLEPFTTALYKIATPELRQSMYNAYVVQTPAREIAK